VIELLVAIAGYLPEAWPSERTLARKLGRTQQSVHRTLDRARSEGLVKTTPRPLEHSYRDGQTYTLLCLSLPLQAAIARHHFQTSSDVRSKSSSSKKTSTSSLLRRDSSLRGSASLTQTPEEAKEVLVAKNADGSPWRENQDDPEQAQGAPDERYVVPPVRLVPAVDPAIALSQEFKDLWAAAKRKHRDLLGLTRSANAGMAIGYLRNTMLLEVDPEHVRAYMVAFIDAVVAGDVVVKEGQFAFEKFTAWWGREDVEDPSERRQIQAQASDVIERYRQTLATGDGLTGL
jgi:hypothetical protein